MINIIFEQPDGVEKQVSATEGANLMEVAVANGVAGIVGTCSGSMTCGSCHIYLSSQIVEELGAIDEFEDDLLEFAEVERKQGSRLGCQVKVTSSMNGMRIEVPQNQ